MHLHYLQNEKFASTFRGQNRERADQHGRSLFADFVLTIPPNPNTTRSWKRLPSPAQGNKRRVKYSANGQTLQNRTAFPGKDSEATRAARVPNYAQRQKETPPGSVAHRETLIIQEENRSDATKCDRGNPEFSPTAGCRIPLRVFPAQQLLRRP